MTLSIKVQGAQFTKFVAVMLQSIRFLGRSGAVESFSRGSYAYTFNPADTAKFLNNATMSLPAANDGFLSCQINMSVAGATATNPVLIASPERNAQNYVGAGRYGVYVGIGGVINVTEGAQGGISCNVRPNVIFNNGDILRLRRVGSSWFAEISADNGKSYVLLHNFGSTNAATMYPVLEIVGGTYAEPMELRFYGSGSVTPL